MKEETINTIKAAAVVMLVYSALIGGFILNGL